MKKLTAIGSILLLAGTFCLADDSKPNPCKQIVQACKQAGFKMGMMARKDGKGLYKNCVDPIIAGQSVDGVTVDATVVSACQAQKGKTKSATPAPAAAQ